MKDTWLVVVLAVSTRAYPAPAQTLSIVHPFSGAEGAYPSGSLILAEATLYGMTSGSVFKLNVDGSSVTNLHAFSSYGGNGKSAYAALTLSDSMLYGMTVEGGRGLGVVFRVGTNGAGYTNLHTFVGGANDGSSPYGSLTLVGSQLHGMTARGGASGLGTLFRVDSSGGGFTLLHSFNGGPTDGANPMGDLLVSGTAFYGLTTQGGVNNLGALFRVSTDGSGYTNLHSFAGYPRDGSGPPGSLVSDGATLYGMTQAGGGDTHKLGAVFRIEIDGSGYRVLHSFAGGDNDGSTPLGSLTLVDGNLYGMTSAGGPSKYGVVFRLSTDGSSYTNLHRFTVSAADGAAPHGSLLARGSMLYGMTYYGGTNNRGVVFALPIPAPETPSVALTIATTQDQVIVSWPAALSGWTLQTSPQLSAGGWSNYPGPIFHNAATNPATQGTLFFRLAR